MKKVNMERELSELRFESITTASELMGSVFPRRWRNGFRRRGLIWCRKEAAYQKIKRENNLEFR